MTDTYRLTVAVRRRTDRNDPATIDEAVLMVQRILAESEKLQVLSVLPEQSGNADKVKWG